MGTRGMTVSEMARKGGKARALALTKERRSEIARGAYRATRRYKERPPEPAPPRETTIRPEMSKEDAAQLVQERRGYHIED